MSAERRVEHVTCLGCGCGCDDVTVTVRENRIAAADPVCPLGRAWLGDGQVPAGIRAGGGPVSLEQALATAAADLARARGRCLVYLGSDLTSQAQRAALGIADLLGAVVDCSTSDTAANGLLTAQRRGRAGATLGEIRNRADAFLFWGVDPTERYPRFLSRYGIESVGTHVPEGRRGRDVISVSIGADRALAAADLVLELDPNQEIPVLSFIRAAVQRQRLPDSPVASLALQISARLSRARYAAVVHDAEPTREPRNPLRAEALIALTQALNGPTRCALCTLRVGRNHVGAEAVLTWQTGFPFSVDFSRGYPRYLPSERGIWKLPRGAYAAALLAGSPGLGNEAEAALGAMPTVLIGPRASEASFTVTVAIDTGVAGIHEGGVAYRMDEVPLPLRPPLGSPRSTAEVLVALHGRIRQELRGAPR